MDEAYELVQEATAHGWEGLAHAVQAAHDNLEAAASNLDSAQGAADRALAGVVEIRSAVNADEVADRLAGVIGQADEVQDVLEVATASADEAHTWARQAEASNLTGMTSGLVESLDTARQVVLEVREAVEKEHQEAVAWGSRSGVGGSGAVSPKPAARWPGYPALAAVPLSWSDRMHILYGDELNPTSGGHLHGVNRPGKTEFPRDWDEDMIVDMVTDVARHPDTATRRIDGTWRATGERHGVAIRVYVRPDGTIAAGFPRGGPGVKKNSG
jgi:hypothetical protein